MSGEPLAGRIARVTGGSGGIGDETLAVNLRAPYLLARRVLPGMRARGVREDPLFTSSVAALTGGIAGPDYASSKAGLHV
jgi:3-oxoacyl-[acyl-carrier protein] reductase